MKYDLGELKMNKKIFLSVCAVCLFGIMGCTSSRPDYSECNGPDCQDSTDYLCQTNYDPVLCASDPFVNYTRTAADFREYGERTPRSHMISQAAAGNNLSATIPPSIEDEVVSYEEQLNVPVENKEPKSAPQPATPVTQQQVASVQEQIPAPVTATAEKEVSKLDDIEYEDDDLLDIEVDEEISETIDEDSEDGEDPVQDWLAEEGQNLKALLTEWSEQSGWRLIWNTNRNYVLNAGAMFRGRFADVSSALVRAFARARPAPIATFYKGNRVLVVETMEDENAYE